MTGAAGRRPRGPAWAPHRLPPGEFAAVELPASVRNVMTLPDGERVTVALRTGLDDAELVRPVMLRLERPCTGETAALWLPPGAARAAGVRLIVVAEQGDRPGWGLPPPLPVG